MKFRKCWFAAVTAIMLCAGTANADSSSPVFSGTYVDMYLKQNTFPGGLSEEKVYLDAATSSTITGHVGSQTGAQAVTFSSTTDTLDAANGFATIKAADGYINNLAITAPGYLFEDLIFSVNLNQPPPPKGTENLTITAMDSSGATESFAGMVSAAGWGSGQNDILVLSKSGLLMQSVTITSSFGFQSLGGVDQFKQTQISGITPVPEPETYAMLLAGLGLVGFTAHRRNKKRDG